MVVADVLLQWSQHGGCWYLVTMESAWLMSCYSGVSMVVADVLLQWSQHGGCWCLVTMESAQWLLMSCYNEVSTVVADVLLQWSQHGGCWCPDTYLVARYLQPSWCWWYSYNLTQCGNSTHCTTLAEVIPHYLNQWWLITNEVLWHSPGGNSTTNTKDICPGKWLI